MCDHNQQANNNKKVNYMKKNNRMAPPSFVYKVSELNHDNKLMAIIRNPYKLLKAAGLKPGSKVLEVGCGPGVFTIPAAEIVGRDGFIYALDIHPLAIKRVKEKIAESGTGNIKPAIANAADTGLLDKEIDIVFIFGLPSAAGGLTNILPEIHRVLKLGGILAFEKFLRSEKYLITKMENGGFVFESRKGRILRFVK